MRNDFFRKYKAELNAIGQQLAVNFDLPGTTDYQCRLHSDGRAAIHSLWR